MEIPISFHGRRLTINNINKAKHEDNYTCEADVAGRNGSALIHTVHLIVGGKHNVACAAVRSNKRSGSARKGNREADCFKFDVICLLGQP